MWLSTGRRLCLLIGLLRVPLAGLVMADDASGDDANLAMTRHMARDASDDGAFDASFCLGGDGSEHQAQNDVPNSSRDSWWSSDK